MSEEEIFPSATPRPGSEDAAQGDTSAPPGEDHVSGEGGARRWPIRRLALAMGIVLLLVLAGIFAWQTFFPSLSGRLQSGEAYWRAGQLARQERNWDKASSRFAQAIAQTDLVISTLENTQQLRELTEQERKQLGLAYWLRARAIFAAAATQLEKEAAEKQSSPPAGLPSADRGDMLELFLIPDYDSRAAALNSLYRASRYLQTDVAVLREALKHRMNEPFEVWNWPHVRQLAEAVARSDNAEPSLLARAYFVLALHGFYQPEITGESVRLPPAENKQLPAMLESLQWLEKLESVEQPLRFRAVYLRARIWQWLAENARRQRSSDPAEPKKYRQLLEQLLFDPTEGLPGKLGQRAENALAELSPMDIEGVFGLYRLGLAKVGTSGDGVQAEIQNRMRSLSESVVRLAKQAESFPPGRGLHAWRVVEESATVLREVPTRLAPLPDWWRHAGQQLDESAEKIATTFSKETAVTACQALAHLAIQLAQASSAEPAAQRRHWLHRAELWAKRAAEHLKKSARIEPRWKEEQEKLERRIHTLRISTR